MEQFNNYAPEAVGKVRPDKGDAWNGFEWVTPERYEEQRLSTMPHLPPLQASAPEADHEGPGEDAGGWAAALPGLGAGQAQAATAPASGPPGTGGATTPPAPAPAAPVEALAQPTGPDYLPLHLLEGRGGYVPARPGVPPYPGSPAQQADIDNAVRHLLDAVDPRPDRGGLVETPQRAAKAWQHWTRGYAMHPRDVLKVFEDGADGCEEMVVVHGIPIYSHCEHHLAPIFGTATIAYLPNKRIVGLSKLPRLADIFARRLQVQERMTNQIADAIMEHLKPHGCGVVVKARHLCMESRGIQVVGTHTTTSALRGAFKEDPTVRAEFLALARKEEA